MSNILDSNTLLEACESISKLVLDEEVGAVLLEGGLFEWKREDKAIVLSISGSGINFEYSTEDTEDISGIEFAVSMLIEDFLLAVGEREDQIGFDAEPTPAPKWEAPLNGDGIQE